MPAEFILRKNNKWLELLETYQSPHPFRYRCKICSKWSDHYHVENQVRPELASPAGIFLDTKAENKARIVNHQNSKVHQYLLLQLKKDRKEEIESEFQNAPSNDKVSDEGHSYAVTNRHMRLIMAAAKMCLSFETHSTLVYLHEKSGKYQFTLMLSSALKFCSFSFC